MKQISKRVQPLNDKSAKADGKYIFEQKFSVREIVSLLLSSVFKSVGYCIQYVQILYSPVW